MQDIVLIEGNNELNVEMVPIAPPPQARFHMPSTMEVSCKLSSYGNGMYRIQTYSCLITNRGDAPGTHTINWWSDHPDAPTGSRTITLNPGETYNWTHTQWATMLLTYYLEGDWEGDNVSSGRPTTCPQ